MLFSLLPTVLDLLTEFTNGGFDFNLMSTIGTGGSGLGYTIVNFILVYLIGAFIRDTEIRGSFLRLMLCLILLFIWAFFEMRYGTEFIYLRAIEYCNPLVIWLAAEALLLFRGFRVGSRKWINLPAKASFMVYLIHISLLPFFNVRDFSERNIFILALHLLGTVIAIYVVCFVVWFIYDFVMSRLIGVTLAKTALNKPLYPRL